MRTALCVCVILCIWGCGANAEDGDSAATVRAVGVTIHGSQGWEMSIRTNGAGRVNSIRSNPMWGLFLPGTFPLQDLLRRIHQEGTTNRSDIASSYHLAYSVFGSESMTNVLCRGWITNSTMWAEMLRKAASNQFDLKSSFAEDVERHLAPKSVQSIMSTNGVEKSEAELRQAEQDSRVKKLISSMCRGGSDEDVADALAVLKDGAGGAVDDLAMLTLYVMKSRVIGLNTGEWNSLIASNYYECVSHLKRVRLERSTVTQWKDYPQQTAFALELTGGDKMMSLVIRGKWLVDLDQYVQRVKRATGGDASEVDAFVKKEAKAILAEWPNANLRDTMRVLSGEITAKDLDQEMEQKRKVADQQRDTL